MSRDVFDNFPAPSVAKPPKVDGGVMHNKPLPYSPPKGPTSQSHQGPGLAGTNHGNCGSQRKG
jgi:hypothetical protein